MTAGYARESAVNQQEWRSSKTDQRAKEGRKQGMKNLTCKTHNCFIV